MVIYDLRLTMAIDGDVVLFYLAVCAFSKLMKPQQQCLYAKTKKNSREINDSNVVSIQYFIFMDSVVVFPIPIELLRHKVYVM